MSTTPRSDRVRTIISWLSEEKVVKKTRPDFSTVSDGELTDATIRLYNDWIESAELVDDKRDEAWDDYFKAVEDSRAALNEMLPYSLESRRRGLLGEVASKVLGYYVNTERTTDE